MKNPGRIGCNSSNVSLSAFLLCALASTTACNSTALAAGNAEPPIYDQILYELGAYPVAKLTKPYFDNGHPGQVYSKGERIDVDGWVPPYWAPRYLTVTERLKYANRRKKQTYEEYVKLLDVDTYKRTRHPQLFLVMRFALENMNEEGMHLKREDFLRVFEARVGLEKWAISLVWDSLPSEDAMRLIRTYADEKLFNALPPPKPAEKAYIAFLAEQGRAAKWSVTSRLRAWELLYAVDRSAFENPYREFLLSSVKAEDWVDRARILRALVKLKDEESRKAIRDALLHDPITECRETILYQLQQEKEVASVIDAILVIVSGKDLAHHALSPSRMSGQWSYELKEYLTWAKSVKTLDAATAQKVNEAMAKLATMPETP